MARKRTYEQQAVDIEEQIRRLQERRREVLARESEADRKGERATAYALGSLLLERFDGGWRTVDLERIEAVVDRSSEVFARCVADELPVEEAARRTREWQRAHRERDQARYADASTEEDGE